MRLLFLCWAIVLRALGGLGVSSEPGPKVGRLTVELSGGAGTEARNVQVGALNLELYRIGVLVSQRVHVPLYDMLWSGSALYVGTLEPRFFIIWVLEFSGYRRLL